MAESVQDPRLSDIVWKMQGHGLVEKKINKSFTASNGCEWVAALIDTPFCKLSNRRQTLILLTECNRVTWIFDIHIYGNLTKF